MPDGSNEKIKTKGFDKNVKIGENKRSTRVFRPMKVVIFFILKERKGYIERKKQIDKYVITIPQNDPRFKLSGKQHRAANGRNENLVG